MLTCNTIRISICRNCQLDRAEIEPIQIAGIADFKEIVAIEPLRGAVKSAGVSSLSKTARHADIGR